MNASLPREFFLRCRQHTVAPSRFIFHVRIASQTSLLFERAVGKQNQRAVAAEVGVGGAAGDYELRQRHVISTSRFGIGSVAGSNRTPLGLHRVAQKIGGRYHAGAVFESRRLVGYTWDGRPDAPIAHRILWLEGLEPGLNRGGNVDTHARYIYIHGVGDESRLGRPASHGCIHLSAADLLPFYRLVPKGTLVWITRR
ncbi:MAG: L,D-transpeptidase [Verrucomicrobia bacterium]|nr:L,D-transpeptidase [Verrucomicrobiota bacterium]